MGALVFDEVEHKYYLDGKELISVTQLLSKFGLAPSYEHVNSDVLEKAAAKGTLVHKEIEEYIKNREVGFTEELQSFIKYVIENDIKFIASEKMVHNDVCAGTCDMLCKYNRTGKIARVDFKTTSTIHKLVVSWQLSLYDDMDDVKADVLEAWHFLADGSLEVKEMPFIPKENVDKLFSDERNGVLPTLVLSANEIAIVNEAQSLYDEAAEMKKKADEMLANIRDALIAAFEKNNIKTFENNYIRITYVAPTTRSGFDSARFKKDHPDLSNEYTKSSPVAASLKITRKGD